MKKNLIHKITNTLIDFSDADQYELCVWLIGKESLQVFKLGSLAQTKDIRQNIAKLNLKLNFNVRGDEIRLRSIRKEILYLFGLAGIEVWLDESIRKILPTKTSRL